MNDDLIRVAVVAPVHNRKAITLQCLRSLYRSNTDGILLDVVIIDDGSTDGTGDAIREQYPLVDVIEGDGSLWFTEGTNVGIRRALDRDPKYILLINDDQVFDADCIRVMVETAETYPKSVVGPLLLLWDTPHRLFQTSPEWDTLYGGWRHWDRQTVWTVPNRPWKVDLIVGNCVLVPTVAIRENGLMDSKRYPNFGDAEYTPRLKRRGWELLIDPRARVFCQPNTPPPTLRKMALPKLFSALITDRGKNPNLRRRFSESLDGAPTKMHGLTAFAVFIGRLAFGSRRAADVEEPLSKRFASAVVNDHSTSPGKT